MVKDLNPAQQSKDHKLLDQSRWQYMDKTTKDLYQKALACWQERNCYTRENWKMGLLMVIASSNGGPYVYQTCLGWCNVGPMSNMVGKDSIGCHHIAVQDAISSKIADYQFVLEESMKDISLEMFQKMHQNDFVAKKVINDNGLLENMVEISMHNNK